MEALKAMMPTIVIFPAAALAALVWVSWRGAFSAKAFHDAPARNVGFGPLDLFGGLVAMLLGATLYAVLLRQAGVMTEDGQTDFANMTQASLWGVIGQLAAKLPIVALVLFRLFPSPGSMKRFGLLPRRPWHELTLGLGTLILAIAMVFGVSTVMMAITALLKQPTPQIGHEMLEQLVETDERMAMVLMVISAAIVAPILEEIVFRGLVQTSLLNWICGVRAGVNSPTERPEDDLADTLSRGASVRWVVIVLASLLFAAIHGEVVTWQMLPSLFVLGLILGWLYEKTGSLLTCIVVHMGFNGFNLAWAILYLRA